MDNAIYLDRYMNDYIGTINKMGEIINIEWIDCYICDMVRYTDNTGKSMLIAIHHARDAKNGFIGEIDAIMHNYMLKKIFRENGITQIPEYPLESTYVGCLIRDAIRLMRLKHSEKDISEFEFDTYEKMHWKREEQ